MEIRRLRCRPGLGERPEHRNGSSIRPEDFAEKMRCRRLAVGSGDADEVERSDRITVHDRGNVTHGLADVSHLELGNGEAQRTLDEKRHCAIGDGIAGEVVAITPASRYAAEHR